MADKKKSEDAEVAVEPKKKPILLFIIIGVVMLAVGAGGAFFFLSSPSDDEAAIEAELEKEAEEGPKKPDTSMPDDIGVVKELPPFVVNLADPQARHFLKASISLELKDEESAELVDKLMPRIRNDVLMLFSSQTMEDIISQEGKVRLRDEIIARISHILGPGHLKNVYFTQFVVQ